MGVDVEDFIKSKKTIKILEKELKPRMIRYVSGKIYSTPDETILTNYLKRMLIWEETDIDKLGDVMERKFYESIEYIKNHHKDKEKTEKYKIYVEFLKDMIY